MRIIIDLRYLYIFFVLFYIAQISRLLTQIGRDLAALKKFQMKQETHESDLNGLKSQLPKFQANYDEAMLITDKKVASSCGC